MILVCDIGNTNIVLGLFAGDDLVEQWRLTTRIDRTADELGRFIRSLLVGVNVDPRQVEGVLVSSVVPQMNGKFIAAAEKYLQNTPKFLTADSACMAIDVDDPTTVGPDRIANTTAGFEIYGGPLLIIDFGTAVTFDLVSEEGVFVGGAIAPEMSLAAAALIQHAALLPEVDLTLPESVIAKNTKTNIQAGVLLGFIDLVSGLIERFKREYRSDLKVVATGGKGELFFRNIEAIEEYDPFLTLRGIMISWSKEGCRQSEQGDRAG